MPSQSSASSREKSTAVAVLRIGSHPLVYSAAFILITGALVFFLAIVPLVRMLQSGGKASISDARERNRVAQNTLDAEKKLADAASSLSAADRDMLAYALPAEPDAPGLVVIMKSLAIASGVKLTSFDVSTPSTSEGSVASAAGQAIITASLDLVTYDRLKIFLTNMENSLRIFDLKSLSFSPGTGSASIQVVSYYLNNI
jgi:hypothetical protein